MTKGFQPTITSRTKGVVAVNAPAVTCKPLGTVSIELHDRGFDRHGRRVLQLFASVAVRRAADIDNYS